MPETTSGECLAIQDLHRRRRCGTQQPANISDTAPSVQRKVTSVAPRQAPRKQAAVRMRAPQQAHIKAAVSLRAGPFQMSLEPGKYNQSSLCSLYDNGSRFGCSISNPSYKEEMPNLWGTRLNLRRFGAALENNSIFFVGDSFSEQHARSTACTMRAVVRAPPAFDAAMCWTRERGHSFTRGRVCFVQAGKGADDRSTRAAFNHIIHSEGLQMNDVFVVNEGAWHRFEPPFDGTVDPKAQLELARAQVVCTIATHFLPRHLPYSVAPLAPSQQLCCANPVHRSGMALTRPACSRGASRWCGARRRLRTLRRPPGYSARSMAITTRKGRVCQWHDQGPTSSHL